MQKASADGANCTVCANIPALTVLRSMYKKNVICRPLGQQERHFCFDSGNICSFKRVQLDRDTSVTSSSRCRWRSKWEKKKVSGRRSQRLPLDNRTTAALYDKSCISSTHSGISLRCNGKSIKGWKCINCKTTGANYALGAMIWLPIRVVLPLWVLNFAAFA